MAQFYDPEQWKQLSDEDKKSFFKGLWPDTGVAKMADGGMVQDPDFNPMGDVPMPNTEAVAPAASMPMAMNPDLSLQSALATPAPMPVALGSSAGNMAGDTAIPSVIGQQQSGRFPTLTTTETMHTAPIKGAAELQSQGEAARGKGLAAVEAMAPTNIQEAKDTETLLAGFKEDQAKLESERVAKEQERQAQLAEGQAKVNDMIEETKNLRVDPNKFYADKGAFGSLMLGLAAGVGQYSAVMTGSKNFAGEMIDRAIDRDIDAQKANIEQKSKAVGQQMNLYQMMRERFKDSRDADLATKVALRESVIDNLKNLQAKSAAANAPFVQAKVLADEEAKQVNDKINLIKATTPQDATKTTRAETPKGTLIPIESQDKEVKELNESKMAIKNYDELIKMTKEDPQTFGRVKGIVESFKRTVANSNDPKFIKAQTQEALTQLRSAKPMFSRVSEFELNALADIHPTMWNSPDQVRDKLMQIRADVAGSHNLRIEQMDRLGYNPSLVETVRVPKTFEELNKTKK